MNSNSMASLPDMEFIRRNVPIAEVWTALGERLAGRYAAHCWRTEHHKNGDRTASVSFRKNRAACYVCDHSPLSPLDLVAAHEGLDLLDAARWISARWDVPTIAKGKKLVRPERWHPGRVGSACFSFLEELIRSGYWATLDDATRAILPALACLADSSTGEAEISYRGLSRYSGKASPTTVAAVIKKLEKIGLLKVTRARDGKFRACGRYTLDWFNERYQATLRSCCEAFTVERDAERILRAQDKQARAQALLLRSKDLSTLVECEQSTQSSLVERALEDGDLGKESRVPAHSSVVERGVSQRFNPQALSLPVWEPPTFVELRWPENVEELRRLGWEEREAA